jgi:hypothetical protein
LILFTHFEGFVWLLLTLGPLIFLQRSLHHEIQSVFLLVTRRVEISTVLFSLLFFPGVLMHEMSHYLMAKLLFVKTGRIYLIPQISNDGQMRLGYVETLVSDPFRDTLIGAAPMIVGGAFVAYAGLVRLNLSSMIEITLAEGLSSGLNSLIIVFNQPDFFLWFYLVFVVSSMMLPSVSDRRSWLSIGMWLALIVLIGVFAGAGPWLLEHIAPWLNKVLSSIAIILGISAIVHLVALPVFWFLHRLISKITGYEVSR